MQVASGGLAQVQDRTRQGRGSSLGRSRIIGMSSSLLSGILRVLKFGAAAWQTHQAGPHDGTRGSRVAELGSWFRSSSCATRPRVSEAKRRASSFVHGVRVRITQQMAVPIEGLAHARVPHDLGHGLHIGAGRDQVRGEAMASLVRASLAESRSLPTPSLSACRARCKRTARTSRIRARDRSAAQAQRARCAGEKRPKRSDIGTSRLPAKLFLVRSRLHARPKTAGRG